MFEHIFTSRIEKIMNRIEVSAAKFQGKGTGASSISKEVAAVCHLLGRKPQLAIDIGGNVGAYTARLRERFPELEVHVFEPSVVNVEKLHARFSEDHVVTVVPCAVSDRSGSAILFSDRAGSGLGSLSRRRLDHFSISFKNEEEVSVLRFEDYWNEVLLRRHMDIVKIDIEGHELSALRGFGAALEQTSVIQFEFGGCNIDTRTYFQDFWYFFKEHHFDLFRISPLGVMRVPKYRESDEFFSTTNFVAVRMDAGTNEPR